MCVHVHACIHVLVNTRTFLQEEFTIEVTENLELWCFPVLVCKRGKDDSQKFKQVTLNVVDMAAGDRPATTIHWSRCTATAISGVRGQTARPGAFSECKDTISHLPCGRPRIWLSPTTPAQQNQASSFCGGQAATVDRRQSTGTQQDGRLWERCPQDESLWAAVAINMQATD